MKTSNSRAIAAKILADLESGSGSLATHLGEYKQLDDAGLLQETCYGCCRWFHLFESLLAGLLTKPIRRKDRDLKCLLIVGLYQLRNLSTPEYAVINETVAAAAILGKTWGKSLVNAVLRNYLRNRDAIEKSLEQGPDTVTLSHPDWLLTELRQQWPQHAQQIARGNNERPPMTLRVNLAQGDRKQCLERLQGAGISACAGELAPTAVYLDKPMAVDDLPGFFEGALSVQDEASQLAVAFLQLGPGMRVLDACAAPGGKTCHILESESSLTECVALDIDAGRLTRIQENLDRLRLQAQLQTANAARLKSWWDGREFDRILLDAPCSATGVIRRHPDIKLLRNEENIRSLMATQRALLRSLWPSLKSGGLLLYTTCSVLRQENEDTISDFLECCDSAKYEGITADWGVECPNGRQLLPSAGNGPDGFFYSLLRKI